MPDTPSQDPAAAHRVARLIYVGFVTMALLAIVLTLWAMTSDEISTMALIPLWVLVVVDWFMARWYAARARRIETEAKGREAGG
ncbi:MAG: hypothetical protein GVY28_05520 [Alphaproteobacteria bacterium]|jgi:L-asparagine transporter-like permease|nr:hypothetical protein [Alphaproteobacteria bacterium]